MSKNLRTILLDLYDDKEAIKLMAEDLGIPAGYIDWTGTAKVAMQEVVKEAGKRGLTDALIEYAASEYPENEDLKSLSSD